ncbi:MAG TPA: radical SAM family RiPP maturation amino acid epimerase [Desulfuromonadales bacterium]|nr:radical SAM family RiPP maturation amino acid epimerase [Desulfuromonadales bacterium]
MTDAPHQNVAHIKRFLELLEGDPDFRREAMADPSGHQQLLDKAGIRLPAAALAPFWDLLEKDDLLSMGREELSQEIQDHSLGQEWIEWTDARTAQRDACLSEWESTGNRRLDLWRTRQQARAVSESFDKNEARSMIFPLFAFELSKGCSMQCWFCALAPPPLQGNFLYTPDNRQLWGDILVTARTLFGDGCKVSTCYHATEPSDNPDYFKFMRDFHAHFGMIPQTTTAAPLRNRAWTDELLSFRDEWPLIADRFSVLSRSVLQRIHQEFTPEELLNVTLTLQNEGALREKISSGRTLHTPCCTATRLDQSGSGPEPVSTPRLTIECTCGYLVNMVDRTIKLISPCNASERWPLGYQIHLEGAFEDAAGFRVFIERSIDECMPASLKNDLLLSFRADLVYEPGDVGFTLISRYTRHEIKGNRHMRLLGDLVQQGNLSVNDVTARLIETGMPALSAISWLNRLYQSGFFSEHWAAALNR